MSSRRLANCSWPSKMHTKKKVQFKHQKKKKKKKIKKRKKKKPKTTQQANHAAATKSNLFLALSLKEKKLSVDLDQTIFATIPFLHQALHLMVPKLFQQSSKKHLFCSFVQFYAPNVASKSFFRPSSSPKAQLAREIARTMTNQFCVCQKNDEKSSMACLAIQPPNNPQMAEWAAFSCPTRI
jgi:hypothetical protein